MAKKDKKSKETKRATSVLNPASRTLFDRAEEWLGARDKTLLWITLGLTLLFSFFLFNARISEANDDSEYIEGAWNYAKDFTGYSFTSKAPAYPMLLSLPVSIF